MTPGDAAVAAGLAEVAALRARGEHDAAHARAVALVAAHPDEVHVVMAAAYACDRIGRERDAVVHYDHAWTLGVPEAERPGFLVGYGSTLRNVGRVADAVARLDEAVARYPEHAALHAFRALALHDAGRHAEALATMLAAGLLAARAGGFEGYERALHEYHDELAANALAR